MLYPFVELSSVALSYGANSVNNPAGLSYGGSEFLLYYADSSYGFNVTFGNFGIGYGYSGGHSLFLSSAFGGDPVSIGGGYDPLNGRWNAGILIRPYRFLSFGAVLNAGRGGLSSMDVGVGIRPLKNYITAYAGTRYTKLDLTDGADINEIVGINPVFGVFVQPLPYVGLRFEASSSDLKNYRLSAGVEVAFAKLRFGGAFSGKGKSFGLMVSKSYFTPSPKKGRYEVKVKSYTEDGRTGFLGSGKKFYDFISEVNRAVESPNVKVIALDLRGFGLSLAQAEELRELLKRAKEKGKEVLAFSDSYGTASYYVASVGKVYLLPEGDLSFPGLSAELTFFKRTFDSLGIEVQDFRMGKYKSALEPLVRDTMSEANREQYTRLLDVMWGVWLKDVAEGRKMDADSLNSLVKEYMGVFLAGDAKKLGLVDSIIYEDQWKDLLKEKGGKVKLAKVDRREWSTEKPKIAVVVAEGGIVVGESSYNPFPIVGGKTMGDRTMVRVLEKLRKDKSVKAVVLRVNSPGGSALASDNIARAVELLKKEKPVIVSMGSVAASGGYYISALADTILVDRTTVTGSIGVIGAKFVLRDFYKKKLHLNRDVVKTYPFSDAWSLWRPMDSTEVERVRRTIAAVYERFVSVVSKGRGLSEDSVKAIGGGRVWAGYDAVEIGLADGFGGVLDAVELAAKKAKVKDYDVVVYPKPKGTFEKIKGMFGKGASLNFNVEDLVPEGLQILYRMEYDVEVK